MTNENTTENTAAVAPAPSKAELRAATLKANREAKAAAKLEQKAALQAARDNGIIGTLKAALSTPNGTTKNEMISVLSVKFPERDALGMATTVGIQLSRLQKTTGRKIVNRVIDGRGRVYGFEDSIVFPVEGSTGTVAVQVAPVQDAPVQESEPVQEPAPAPVEVQDEPVVDEITEQVEAPAPKGGKGKGKKNR